MSQHTPEIISVDWASTKAELQLSDTEGIAALDISVCTGGVISTSISTQIPLNHEQLDTLAVQALQLAWTQRGHGNRAEYTPQGTLTERLDRLTLHMREAGAIADLNTNPGEVELLAARLFGLAQALREHRSPNAENCSETS